MPAKIATRKGAERLVPAWMTDYQRSWLRFDIVAGLVIWSVVTPQAVAYAQIAGLPPQAGLVAAPGALIAYALLGTSRQLVVSATTATSAMSAATVGPLAHGDAASFAGLSAALAIVTAVVLIAAGVLHLGAVADLVSKPVMTGFLFGLGLTITIGQLPSVFGVTAGHGNFFPQLHQLIDHLDSVHWATLAVGAGSIAVLLLGRRIAPTLPWTLIVLVASIVVSALLSLGDHGVAIVGHIPHALPDPAIPHVGAHDIGDLVAPAFGVLVLSAEAAGVARQLAIAHDYQVDPNRDLVAMGASNLLAGLSSGFVQSGGASQTAAADGAGGRSQLATLICAGLVLLTGAFLAPLFKDLPEAALAAIVVVAVSGFYDVAALLRFARIRRTAIVFAILALAGVLALGVLQGLVVTAALSLIYVVQRISRPSLGRLARNPADGAWGRVERHPAWEQPDGVLVIRGEGPLLYPNADTFRQYVIEQVASSAPRPVAVVLDMSRSAALDVQSADTIGQLAHQLDQQGIALRLAEVSAPVAEILARAGVASAVAIAKTIDAAIS
jgi:SulP family sulfate permease